MPIFRLCADDPLVRVLGDVFSANIVRVPDSRIQPLSVVAQTTDGCYFRGALAPLLEGGPPLDLPLSSSTVADISGRRSRRVTLDLGLHILRGFLWGLGVPSAELGVAFEGVSAISFAFPEVTRSAVDVNALGSALSGLSLSRSNLAGAVFFHEGSELLVVDSVLSSAAITLQLSGQRGGKISLDLAGLERLVAGTGVQVATTDNPDSILSFSGEQSLTFAFSCVRLCFDQHGRFTALPPDIQARTLGETAEASHLRRLGHVLLSSQPGLIMWDD